MNYESRGKGMSSYVLLRKVKLRTEQIPAWMGGGDAVSHLEIIRYKGDVGCYLFYLSRDGRPQADIYYDTEEDAMLQACREFGIEPDEWEIVTQEEI